MKKNLIFTLALASTMLFAATSCDKQASKMDEKASDNTTQGISSKIAYVEIDSIMSQYNFCKENSKVLESKGKNIQTTIAQKGQALQAAAAKFQQDVQNNKYTQQQAEAVQAGLQKQDADLRALQQRLGADFQEETDNFNKALRDSVQHFLAVYNKDKKYALIISKSGDNILYADKAYDITNEVIQGLNKAYKGTAKKAEK